MDVEELFYKGDFEMKQPKMFYLCYDHQTPTGGHKQMYRHVDILNRNGYQAYAVHTIKGFRLTWFDNDTKTIDRQRFNNLYNKNRDYIVLPEDLGREILAFSGKKVIFNQNIYHGFNTFGFNKIDKWPYLDNNVKFVMTVSAHNQRYLQFIFPNLRIRRVYNGVDAEKFTYKPLAKKEKMIAILPGKAPVDNTFLFQTLSARAKQNLNPLRRYKWQFVDRCSEEEMAKIFGQSLIFVFLSIYEGCPLMPLEAMLSGAIVVAYKRGPYAEYLNNANSFLVDVSDKLGVIKIVEDIAEKFESKSKDLTLVSQKADETARRYSLEREEKSVLQFWKEALPCKL